MYIALNYIPMKIYDVHECYSYRLNDKKQGKVFSLLNCNTLHISVYMVVVVNIPLHSGCLALHYIKRIDNKNATL